MVLAFDLGLIVGIYWATEFYKKGKNQISPEDQLLIDASKGLIDTIEKRDKN